MTMDERFASAKKKFISPVVMFSNFLNEALDAEDHFHRLLAVDCDEGEEALAEMGEGDFNQQDALKGDETDEQPAEMRRHCKRVFKAEGYGSAMVHEAIEEILDDFEFIQELTPATHYDITIPPQDTGLWTHVELRRIRYAYPTTVMKNALVGRGKYFKWGAKHLETSPQQLEEQRRGSKDIIVTANLLAPQNREPERDEIQPYRNRCEVKLLVRGETLLSELCDAIICPSSLWTNQRVDDGMQLDPDFDFGALFQGHFLFVHDTFYVAGTGRQEDPTQTTREFINRKGKQFGRYKRRDLQGVRVSDLSLRLGQPYLFKHQGECEHLVIFSDLRLLNARDEQQACHYPVKVFDNRLEILCFFCEKAMATRVVNDGGGRLPLVPAHLCARCFNEFFGPDAEKRCQARYYRNTQLGEGGSSLGKILDLDE